MAGIGNLFALIDQLKRNVGRNLQDPMGAIELGLLRADEDFKEDPVNAVLGSANIGGGLLGMTKAAKGAPKASKAAKKLDLPKAPQEDALEAARRNAVEMLGLPENNTAMDRARALGGVDVYHGTKQDAFDSFQPVYGDNLTFTTPDPNFASQWIGKGAKQNRVNSEAEEKAIYDYYKKEKAKVIPPSDDLYNKDPDAWRREFDAVNRPVMDRLQRENAIPGRQFGNVLPLKAMVKNTFDPQKNFDDLKEFFQANPSMADPSIADMYKRGDYIVYESKPMVDYLKSKGYDSMMLRESAGGPVTTMAVFDPKKLRSRFAAFDPARRNENNLLASRLLPLALPGLLFAGDEEEE